MTPSRVLLLDRPPRRQHPSEEDLREFEAAVAADPRVRRTGGGSPGARAASLAAAALFKYGGYAALRALPALPAARRPDGYFAVMMGLQFAKCMPEFLHRAPKSVYLYDVWPSVRDRVVEFVRAFRVDPVFISSSQSAEYVRARVDAEVHWLPEGIDPTHYRACAREARDIDVLQMGRRDLAYHDQIVNSLERHGVTYLYETVPGQIIFPTTGAFVDGLSRSRISVCVPSSMTHPARSGDVETMTLRYLQSMVSRCLVVGHAPAEMVRLFGYNPVVEIDRADPAGQILYLLEHLDRYDDLIVRNDEAVRNAHTWKHRWAHIAEVIFTSRR